VGRRPASPCTGTGCRTPIRMSRCVVQRQSSSLRSARTLEAMTECRAGQACLMSTTFGLSWPGLCHVIAHYCLAAHQAADCVIRPIVLPPAQGLHRRIQPLLVFFIDAVNYLQDEETGAVDPRWEVYLAVRRHGEHRTVVRRCCLGKPMFSHDACERVRARHKRVFGFSTHA